MGFRLAKNRVSIGSGLVESCGFGRFSDPQITASVTNGFLSLVVNNPLDAGWYTAAPTMTITAPSATAIATFGTVGISAGAVTGVPVTAAGHFYTAPPPITFTGGGGTNAAAVGVLVNGGVASVTVTVGGTGYTSAPTAVISNPPATVTTVPTCLLGGGYVFQLNLGGTLTGYTAVPTLAFSGGGGVGAAGHVVWNKTTGALTDLVVDNPGQNYTAAPTVTVSSGSATATAVIAAQVVGFTVTSFGYTSVPTPSFAASAGPNAMVIGVSDPTIVGANAPVIAGNFTNGESLAWAYPKPIGVGANANPGMALPPSPTIVVITRSTSNVLTPDLPFAASWLGN